MNALLTEKTVRAASKKCELSEQTIYRYLLEDEFRQALQAEQVAIYTAATNRLTAGIDQALDVLEYLMKNAKSEAVRRAAADSWLDRTLKLKETIEYEKRISDLEAKQNAKSK